VRLPAKTTSFKDWAQRLDAYAQTDAARDEMSYWLNVLGGRAVRLPVDRPGGDNTEVSARSVTIALTTEETRALLQDVPPIYGTEINDVLLTALAQAFERWSGTHALWVELEGHGREEMFDDVDVSRTVGWFTSMFPARLELKNDTPGEALKSIKEQLRRIPRHGIGFGLLRHVSQDKTLAEMLADQAQSRPEPEVIFNYLGQIDQTLAGTPFAIAPESVGASRSLHNRRTHLLSINGSVAGGRLQLEWSYSENVHRRATIEKLAHDFVDALRSLIAHCQSPEAGGYTPSDFADVELSQADIDALLAETAPRKDNA
jgi:non-ribosomal peptide synthase protein (TIGR01720 family)